MTKIEFGLNVLIYLFTFNHPIILGEEIFMLKGFQTKFFVSKTPNSIFQNFTTSYVDVVRNCLIELKFFLASFS